MPDNFLSHLAPNSTSEQFLSKKHLFLFTLVTIEIVVGSIFLLWFYHTKLKYGRVLGDEAVTPVVIRKHNLIFPTDTAFSQYYEPAPGNQYEDHPSWLPYSARYTINDDGLNDENNHNVEKSPNVFRIITLGDSFTYGLYVNTSDSWPKQLEATLNKEMTSDCKWQRFEVLNLGVAGYDVPYIVERFKRTGRKYNPDLVIWFESSTGFFRYNEVMTPIIDQCLKEKVESIPDDDSKAVAARQCSDDAHMRVNQLYSHDVFYTSVLTTYYDDFFSWIPHDQVKVFTFIQNETFFAWPKLKKRYHNVTFAATVPNIIERNEIVADGHPSVQGHATIAQEIFQNLKKEHMECFTQ